MKITKNQELFLNIALAIFTWSLITVLFEAKEYWWHWFGLIGCFLIGLHWEPFLFKRDNEVRK